MYQTAQRHVKRHALATSSHTLACLLIGLFLAKSALTAAAQTSAPPPSDSQARTPQGEGRQPLSLDARFRQFDDHYATKTAEMKQRIQEALTAIKQAPTATEVTALKATIGRLEAQVTRLTAGMTRTEGVLTGLTARIEATERAQAERTPKESDAMSPSPPGALQKTDRSEKPVDPADTSFAEALAAFHGPKETTEPIRRWLELHPTHPEAAEGYLQLGFYFLNQHQPVMATYYLKHLIAAYPMNLQAKEAQAILSSLPLADAPKPRVLPKKMVKPAKATAQRTAPTRGAVTPQNDARTPKENEAMPQGDTLTPKAVSAPNVTRQRQEGAAPPLSGQLLPVTPRTADKKTEGPVAHPPLPALPAGPPLTPVVPAGPHDQKTP